MLCRRLQRSVARVLTRPGSLSDATIIDAVADHWGPRMDRAEYAPVGFGSHHWLVGTTADWQLFITVDDLSARARFRDEPLDRPLERLEAALTTARDLADAGHELLVAPQRANDGKVLHRLDDRYTMACFPYLQGDVGDLGRYRSPRVRDLVASHLVVLHELDPAIAPRCRVEDFDLPDRAELLAALDESGASWDSGPHAESARVLLHENADGVLGLVNRYDALVVEAQQSQIEWRLTHGEPHGSNVLATRDGVRLVDWDTALVAPCERDIWHLDPDNAVAAMLYAKAGGQEPDSSFLDLYRASWDLSEIAGYIALFRTRHQDNEDLRESLRNLAHYVMQQAP